MRSSFESETSAESTQKEFTLKKSWSTSIRLLELSGRREPNGFSFTRCEWSRLSSGHLAISLQRRMANRGKMGYWIGGGKILILCENWFWYPQCKSSALSIQKYMRKREFPLDPREVESPIMISGTIQCFLENLSGQTTEAFLDSVSHVPLTLSRALIVRGSKRSWTYLKVLAQQAPFFRYAYPNAGLPNEFGQYGSKWANEWLTVRDSEQKVYAKYFRWKLWYYSE